MASVNEQGTPQHLNMAFEKRVVMRTADMTWQPSPSGNVWRKPLAREFAETGHATSVVRYERGASFPRHEHPLGEEILVLDGVFSDETGDYGPGTYLRNPPGTGHAPRSECGCLLFVKLHQFDPSDTQSVCIDTKDALGDSSDEPLTSLLLHEHQRERVQLVRIAEGNVLPLPTAELPAEWFVVEGTLRSLDAEYGPGTWVRDPAPMETARAIDHSVVWMKTGRLPISIRE